MYDPEKQLEEGKSFLQIRHAYRRGGLWEKNMHPYASLDYRLSMLGLELRDLDGHNSNMDKRRRKQRDGALTRVVIEGTIVQRFGENDKKYIAKNTCLVVWSQKTFKPMVGFVTSNTLQIPLLRCSFIFMHLAGVVYGKQASSLLDAIAIRRKTLALER